MTPFTRALVFAATKHDGQFREDGTPYILHPIAVAELVTKAGEMAQVVALLHDTVEDTDATLDVIEAVFGLEVRTAVDSVTHRDGERYDDYLERALDHPVGSLVKEADILHNHYLSPPVVDVARRRRLSAKYTRALDRIQERSAA